MAAAEEAVVNPLLDGVTLKGAKSLLLSITGGRDLTLWEVDEAANRVRQEVDRDANIIVGTTLDESLGDKMRVSIVASGMPAAPVQQGSLAESTDVDAAIPRGLGRSRCVRQAPDRTRSASEGARRSEGPHKGSAHLARRAEKKEGMSKPPSQPPILRSRRTPGAKNGVSNGEVEFQTPQPASSRRAAACARRALPRRMTAVVGGRSTGRNRPRLPSRGRADRAALPCTPDETGAAPDRAAGAASRANQSAAASGSAKQSRRQREAAFFNACPSSSATGGKPRPGRRDVGSKKRRAFGEESRGLQLSRPRSCPSSEKQ